MEADAEGRSEDDVQRDAGQQVHEGADEGGPCGGPHVAGEPRVALGLQGVADAAGEDAEEHQQGLRREALSTLTTSAEVLHDDTEEHDPEARQPLDVGDPHAAAPDVEEQRGAEHRAELREQHHLDAQQATRRHAEERGQREDPAEQRPPAARPDARRGRHDRAGHQQHTPQEDRDVGGVQGVELRLRRVAVQYDVGAELRRH
mmetsp:Transcript_2713/g.9146  ORF Transcript_2713/g.9146 Transcript_2713/m.9146 type:complete len:203 (-) Transcript_2713:108-716(-)